MRSDGRNPFHKHPQQRLAEREQARQKLAGRVSQLRSGLKSRQSQVAPGSQDQGADKSSHVSGSVKHGVAQHSTAGHSKLRIKPQLLDQIEVVHNGEGFRLPHIAEVVISTLLASENAGPICILLPTTDGIAQFASIIAALEGLAFDFPAAQSDFIVQNLKPGTRVRALPDGNVYVVGERERVDGLDGVFMYYTEKKTFESNGRRLVPVEQLLRFEPTTRKLPISKASTKLTKPVPSAIDGLAGTRALGNSMLYKTRVILVGSRAEFERTLATVPLYRNGASDISHVASWADSFAWGAVESGGTATVLHPQGSAGQPLVAVARDLGDLEGLCLDGRSAAGSQVVITDRFDLVMRSLDLANRIGERQRLVLLADARRRSEVAPLSRQGWTIWEPQPWELNAATAAPAKTGLPGFDRIQRSAFAELTPSISYTTTGSDGLSAAHRGLIALGATLTGEAAGYDERMQEISAVLSALFFRCVNGLVAPEDTALLESRTAISRLEMERRYLQRYLGDQAASKLDDVISGIETFLFNGRDSTVTPKGLAILDTCRKDIGEGGASRMLVAGSRPSRDEARMLLTRHGLDVRCGLVSELNDMDDVQDVIAFSVLRSDTFSKFIDPWPAGSMTLIGYDFEVDTYKKRLRWRERERAQHYMSEESRSALTSMPKTRFDNPRHGAQKAEERSSATEDRVLHAFDAIAEADQWKWERRISIPTGGQGEAFQSATIVRFVGRSWMPMTEDHRSATLITSVSGKSAIQEVEASELRPGARIIVREGGERDVIKGLAERIGGKSKYDQLRKRASLWQHAIRSYTKDPHVAGERLKRVGIRRHIVTLQYWLFSSSIIGPRSDNDVLAIAEAFPIPSKTNEDWQDCCNAISELRGLHLTAGMRLTDHLVRQCGRLLFEPTETETAVDLELGTVWVLEVAEIEADPRECPSHILNRIQWLDPAWRETLLRKRTRVTGA